MPMLKKAKLRKAGGATVLTIPAGMLAELDMKAGEEVLVRSTPSQIEIVPQKRRRYALDELLEQCDFSRSKSAEERRWMELDSRGKEVLE